MQLKEKKKKSMDCMAFKFRNFLAFKKSLEIFYNRLFVWIEFNFVLNYC